MTSSYVDPHAQVEAKKAESRERMDAMKVKPLICLLIGLRCVTQQNALIAVRSAMCDSAKCVNC